MPPSSNRRTPISTPSHHHWQDEADAAYLYRLLVRRRAGREEEGSVSATRRGRGPARRGVGAAAARNTAATRARSGRARARGCSPGSARCSARASCCRCCWPRRAARSRAISTCTGARRGARRARTSRCTLARESAEHATTLNQISGKTGEPWHRTESGGFLRNVVYGFNDGLTANFGLVAGVIGASASAAHHTVIVAGVAGLIADALSMGSSGYLAAKSEQEVYANEIAMERDEIALMPEVERDELALIYEAKGMSTESAHALATEVMADPERMLEEQVQEELGHRRAAHVADARRRGSPARRPRSARSFRCFHFSYGRARRRSSLSFVDLDGVALDRRRGALGVHRPERVPVGPRHVRRRTRRRGGRLLRRRVDLAARGVARVSRRQPRLLNAETRRRRGQPRRPGSVAQRAGSSKRPLGVSRRFECRLHGTSELPERQSQNSGSLRTGLHLLGGTSASLRPRVSASLRRVVVVALAAEPTATTRRRC